MLMFKYVTVTLMDTCQLTLIAVSTAAVLVGDTQIVNIGRIAHISILQLFLIHVFLYTACIL